MNRSVVLATADGHRAASTTRLLRELGCAVAVAWDVEDAARLVLDHRPGLVLVDARLPGGHELFELVRGTFARSIRAVVLDVDGRRRALVAEVMAAQPRWRANVDRWDPASSLATSTAP